MRKSVAAIAVSASVLSGAAAGAMWFTPQLSGAQEDETTTEADESTATDEHAAAHRERLAEILAPLVEDGTITQAQADAVIAALDEAGPIGRGHRGGPHGFRAGLDALADLGLTAEIIRAGFEDGQTLAEIATANGVEVQAVIDALVAEANERIDQAVADGRIDETEAEEKKAEAVERITEMVNSEPPVGGRGFGPGGHRHGFGADDTADETTSTTTES